ncbi:MAG: aldolase/citrate lyase family protein [Candidatus Bathyarchaeia archaeon]
MKNRLKDILERGGVAFGITLSIGHPDVAEILGRVGFDFINFDTQHTPLNIATVQDMMQAMSCSTSTPIIRVQWNDISMIVRALDAGAHGIIIPFVNKKEDAERALSYATFPPRGVRSYGPRRAILIDPDYMATADDEILVLPQIETREALENIDSILSVDGIHAFFVGPYDLSRDLGVFTQWGHPVFERALDRILEAAEKSGTAPGMLALTEDVEKTVKRGFRLVNVGGDVGFLTEAASTILARARAVTLQKDT